jgi:hypothetical protein
MEDSDGEYQPQVPVVLRPGQRYQLWRPCEDVPDDCAFGLVGRCVAFTIGDKLVGQALIVAALPGDGGLMLTCELTQLLAN